jgi:hypothetical protein
MAGSTAVNISGSYIYFGNYNASGIFTTTAYSPYLQALPSEDTLKINGAVRIFGNFEVIGGSTISGTLAGTATNAEKVQNISFNTTATAPTGTNRLNCEGIFYATKLVNAVWNDIADYIEVEPDTPIVFGKAYVYANGHHRLSKEYAEKGVLGIASDTLGFGVGQKPLNTPQIPIAIGGFVLAYVDKAYESGTPLTCTENGCLTEMGQGAAMEHPERMIATFYKVEGSPVWNGLEVKGRHWVKVR